MKLLLVLFLLIPSLVFAQDAPFCGSLEQVTPGFTKLNISDGFCIHSKFLGNLSSQFPGCTRSSTNGEHLSLSQFSHTVPLAAWERTVPNGIFNILFVCTVNQMTRVDATKISVSTGMTRFQRLNWYCAVHQQKRNVMSKPSFSVEVQKTIAIVISGKRPQLALVCFDANGGTQPGQECSVWPLRMSSQRIAVPIPLFEMFSAETIPHMWALTAFDRTDAGTIQHDTPPLGALGRDCAATPRGMERSVIGLAA